MLPYVDKPLVTFLKGRYTTRFLLDRTEKDAWNAEKSLGFMLGVSYVLEELDTLSRKDDDD